MIIDAGAKRERRDLDAGVAAVGGEFKRPLVRPIEKRFVADGEFHAIS